MDVDEEASTGNTGENVSKSDKIDNVTCLDSYTNKSAGKVEGSVIKEKYKNKKEGVKVIYIFTR